jgi:hypothetical protein
VSSEIRGDARKFAAERPQLPLDLDDELHLREQTVDVARVTNGLPSSRRGWTTLPRRSPASAANRDRCKDARVPDEPKPKLDLTDFHRYIEEHGLPEEHYPAAFALWFAEVTGGPVPRFEKVEPAEPADGSRSRATTSRRSEASLRCSGVRCRRSALPHGAISTLR